MKLQKKGNGGLQGRIMRKGTVLMSSGVNRLRDVKRLLFMGVDALVADPLEHGVRI